MSTINELLTAKGYTDADLRKVQIVKIGREYKIQPDRWIADKAEFAAKSIALSEILPEGAVVTEPETGTAGAIDWAKGYVRLMVNGQGVADALMLCWPEVRSTYQIG